MRWLISSVLLSYCHAAPLLQKALPVVIWHGLGDSIDNPGLTDLAHTITEEYNVSVHFIQVANDAKADQRASFFGRAWDHIQVASDQIKSIPELKQGYNGIGLSQGGVFMRALAETISEPQMHNLITLGSPHLGISQLPACKSGDWLCKSLEWALTGGIFTAYAQKNVIPAQYFRNQGNIAEYLLNSGFLKDLNNERYGDKQVGGSEDYLDKPGEGHGDSPPRNQTLKDNFTRLANFVMFAFSEDKTIIPYTSSYFTLLNTTELANPTPIKLDKLPLYRKDYIGLKTLDKSHRLHYGLCVGEHMQIDKRCWKDVMKWLGPSSPHSGVESSFVIQ